MKIVAIIGSHGLYAKYGGFDQLVNNLAEKKSKDIKYLIFNPVETPIAPILPKDVSVIRIKLSASGFIGLLYDFLSIIRAFRKVDIFLMLGTQGMPLIPFILLLKKIKIIVNIGGVEWLRPDKSIISVLYLKMCFHLSKIFSDYMIIDNKFFMQYISKKYINKARVIPYGGYIDYSLINSRKTLNKYTFIGKQYYLSISRSIEDNKLHELCDTFTELKKYKLVLISNFSKSKYGLNVFNKYKSHKNLVLIDGLYNKPELDYVRLNAYAYIHTHTLCGTAPSLVEMIVSQIPIISIDNEQNRNTLCNESIYFKSFSHLKDIINNHHNEKDSWIPNKNIVSLYDWHKIISEYENLYR